MPYSRLVRAVLVDTRTGVASAVGSSGWISSKTLQNEQPSQNPRRVAHCRFSSLVSFAAKANLLAIETALLTRRQRSADRNRDKVCQVGVTVNTE